MKNVTDPFDLYETLYWCFIAGQSNRRAQGKDREALVHDALDRIYRKLEGKKIFITIEKENNVERTE